jgi:hypothetical protein
MHGEMLLQFPNPVRNPEPFHITVFLYANETAIILFSAKIKICSAILVRIYYINSVK